MPCWRQRRFIVQLVSLAPFTVLLYEYLITFDREVQYAWDRKLTWATSVFFLNRYLSIFEALAALVSVPSPGDYFVCVVISRIVDTTTAMQYVVWAVFAGLRVYAISEGSKTIASLVVFLALIPPTTINIISAAFTVYFVEAEEPLPVPICFKGGSLTDRDALSRKDI
ncbi:hypothetical protein C8Q80DRAFT_721036 [Daedaleopsis nitida]|nr:hypothetical protein C8Q80DRAFT_721036 [Daedaleopsis nitida]